MRDRSITICEQTAHLKSDFTELTCQLNQTTPLTEESPPVIRKRYSKISYLVKSMNSSFSSLNNEQEANETSDDMLGFIKNYSLEKIKPTLKEQLLIDEEELNQLHLLQRKNRVVITSKKSSSLLADNYFESTLNDSIEGLTFDCEESKKIIERFVKVIISGDKQVGKTTLRNKLIGEDTSHCTPTNSLEIRKRVLETQRSITRFEFWDTNTQIQNSVLMKSKIYLSNPIEQPISKSVIFIYLYAASNQKILYCICRSKLR